jgi:glycosyltransferase involved in cell wall biosynthesis
MHIFFVGEEIPFNGKSGSCIHGWAMVKYLLQEDHRITAFVNPPGWENEDRIEHIDNLRKLGVEVVSLHNLELKSSDRSRIQRLLHPQIEQFYPTIYLKSDIRHIIEKYITELRPHIILAFGIAAIASTDSIKTIPRIAPVCEDPFAIAYSRWRYASKGLVEFFRNFHVMIAARRVLKDIVRLHSRCQVYGQVGPKFAETFRKMGARDCKYYRTPYLNQADISLKKNNSSKNGKVKITMIGMVGTAMYMGLLQLSKILPAIERKLGKECFEIHLIGNITIPLELNGALSTYPIIIRGYVDDIDCDMFSTDIFLVPTHVVLGARSRIITGLSYGCCIVTTVQEQKSRPELVHMDNALIANNTSELIDLLVIAIKDAELRTRIGNNARLTYEKYFVPEVSVKEMEDDMNTIVANFNYSDDYFKMKS